MGRTNENVNLAKKKGYKFTLNQLNKWGLKFHKLVFGKPYANFYIDDFRQHLVKEPVLLALLQHTTQKLQLLQLLKL